MKLMIVTPYFKPSVGGVQIYVNNLVNHLDDEIAIVTTQLPGEPAVIKDNNVTIYRLPVLFKLSNTPVNPFWYFHLRKIINEFQPDIINAHTPVPFISDISAMAARSIPFIITIHAATMLKNDGKLTNSLLRLYSASLGLYTLRKAHTVLAVSEYVKKQLPEWVQYKTKVAPNAVDDKDIPSIKSAKTRNRIIFIASLDRTHAWKGLKDLLSSLALVKASIPDVELIVLGNGDMKSWYENYAQKIGVSKHVKFLGNVMGTKKFELIASSELAVLYPDTANDAFPTFLLESWAADTATLVSRIGSLPHLIEHGRIGILCEPGKPENLSTSIISALSDKKALRDIAASAKETLLDNYVWSVQSKNTASAYENALKRTIIQVSPYYPPHLGGVEQRVKELSEKLVDAGRRVHVYTTKRFWHKPYNNASKGPRVHYSSSFTFANTPISISIVWKLMLTSNRSIFHIHIAQAYIPEVAASVARIRKIPYVAHYRMDVDSTGPFGLLLPVYKKLVLRSVLKGADKVIVLTPDYKQKVIDKYNIPTSRIEVVPNATSFQVSTEPKSKPAIKHKLLFVGRLSYQKNPLLLIKSYHLYTQLHDAPSTLDVVGAGELMQEAVDYVSANNLSDNIKFHGALHGEELESIYSKSDIFILTSRNESFGTVLIEAMSKGLPIIATRAEAVRNVVIDNHNGLLVSHDEKSVAKAINQLVTDKTLYERMSVNNICTVKQYSWHTVIAKTESIYEDIE